MYSYNCRARALLAPVSPALERSIYSPSLESLLLSEGGGGVGKPCVAFVSSSCSPSPPSELGAGVGAGAEAGVGAGVERRS
jgi:hypothetical protein